MSLQLTIKPSLLVKARRAVLLSVVLLSTVFLNACSSDDDSSTDSDSSTDTDTDEIIYSVDESLFDTDSLESIEIVDCTLSNGDSTSCYEITVSGFPSDRTELGPFCPTTLTTAAEDAGKWFDDGVLYDLTGDFISSLDTFYGDDNWLLYDETTSEVKITDTQTSCEAAARPDVADEYNNYCVQCDIDYYSEEEGGGVSSTYLIPVTPVLRSSSDSIGNDGVGVAFNGVNLAAAAPTDAILSAYTIAAFDDCIGHVNPFEGYHYHGANHGDGTCPAIEYETDGHAGAFAYALDGFAIYSMLDESGEEESDLDTCRGHTDETRGYHYHSAGPGENTFIGCFSGEVAE
jgi:hypothetical protein